MKDLLLAHSIALAEAPDGQAITKEHGAFGGTHLHFLRMLLGFLYELLNVIRKNRAIVNAPTFQMAITGLSPKARVAWSKVLAVAEGDESKRSDDDIRLLLLVRNRAAYHYDPAALGEGFSACYAARTSSEAPYVSRGNRIAESRFYFADRAAQRFLSDLLGESVESFLTNRSEFVHSIGIALFTIVTRFIEGSGGAWRSAQDDEVV